MNIIVIFLNQNKMKVQEQILDIRNGRDYWLIHFEIQHDQQLTTDEWFEIEELIYNYIRKKDDKD